MWASLCLVTLLAVVAHSDHFSHGRRYCPKVYYVQSLRHGVYYRTCYRYGYPYRCPYRSTYYVTERRLNVTNCCPGYTGPRCEPECNNTQYIQVTKWESYYTTCSWWFRRWTCIQQRVVYVPKKICCDYPSYPAYNCTETSTSLMTTEATSPTTLADTTTTLETSTSLVTTGAVSPTALGVTSTSQSTTIEDVSEEATTDMLTTP